LFAEWHVDFVEELDDYLLDAISVVRRKHFNRIYPREGLWLLGICAEGVMPVLKTVIAVLITLVAISCLVEAKFELEMLVHSSHFVFKIESDFSILLVDIFD